MLVLERGESTADTMVDVGDVDADLELGRKRAILDLIAENDRGAFVDDGVTEVIVVDDPLS